MLKLSIKLAWLTLALSTLVLTACGTDTTTPVPAATAIATTVTTAVAITTAAVTTTATTALTATTTSAMGLSRMLRNVRYCEVIPVYQESGKYVQYVYNTLGLNDCPAATWQALNADDLAKSLGAVKVALNGPRYWVLDQIIAHGATANGEVKTFGGIQMQYRAKIEVPAVSQTLSSGVYYQATTVQRTTEFVYLAGKPTYQLTSPQGDTYIMQTYAQIIDTKLNLEDLANLGARLQLPTGWQYQVVTPSQDLHLVANGAAYVLQDNLENSYQKVIK
jgi:hypothetical protein